MKSNEKIFLLKMHKKHNKILCKIAKRKILLKCTKNTIKFCTNIQNFEKSKKIQKMENCQNVQKFSSYFVENHKMLVVKMHKKRYSKKVFLYKMYKFSKNQKKIKKTYCNF